MINFAKCNCKKKNQKRFVLELFLLGLMALLLNSCDCMTHKVGVVVDSQTGEPILGARIKFDRYETLTDSNGYYQFNFVTGFCPDWKYYVTKDSYKPFELKIDLKRDYVIYKLKDEQKFCEYDKPIPHPFYPNSTLNGEWIKMNSTQFIAVTKDSLVIKLENDSIIQVVQQKCQCQ